MKKVIKKYWGVGLVIVLLSSLFIAAAPTSGADPLRWEYKVDGPSGMFYDLVAAGTDVTDYAIDSSGMVLYATTNGTLLMSDSGGGIWTDISARVPGGAQGPTTAENVDLDTYDLVAMAPDDSSVVVVVDSSANSSEYIGAAITIDGGATFSSMGQIGTLSQYMVATGVEISPMVTGGVRYIAIYGKNAQNDSPCVYYYNYGAGVGAWIEAVTGTTWTASWTAGDSTASPNSIAAMKFSPNFPSDFMAVAVEADTANGTANYGGIYLHTMSFASKGWDNVGTSYPVAVTGPATGGTAFTVDSASVALIPDYDGSDESLRIAFVGAAITAAAEAGGIWRCYDDNPAQRIYGTATTGIAINSVATDGTNLAAGAYDTNNVYRSADPLATSPTFLGARSLKKIGIDDTAGADSNDQVQVEFIGELLYGAKIGDASALSKSTDYGYTWNDFTLIEQGTTTIDDIYVSSNGDPWYLAAHDGTTSAVFRISMYSVDRVLCVAETAGAPDFILRGIPDDPNVVYAADEGGTVLYYTADGGVDRWYQRNNVPIAITDMAVESAQIVYFVNGINFYKSSNAGFTWDLPVNDQLTGGNVANTIAALGDSKIVVGGSAGGCVYSSDGGATWTKTFGVLVAGTGALQVAASGLAAGDYIFAADEATNDIYRCEIGPSNPFGEFKDMNAPATAGTAAETNTGIIYYEGALYVISANGTDTWLLRSLSPTVAGTHAEAYWGTRFEDNITYTPAGSGTYLSTNEFSIDSSPSALKVSSGAGGGIMLYGVETQGSIFVGLVATPATYYFEDNVALTGPTSTGPAIGSTVDINSVTGVPYSVNLQWARISKATAYEVQLAIDESFTSLVNIDAQSTGGTTGDDPAAEIAGAYDSMSLILPGATFQPGQTYYWRVRSYLPIVSAWSQTGSFTVMPGAAAVPTIASPVNGASIDNTAPAFSWSPVSQATMYEFQLAADTSFADPLVSEQLANTGIQPAVTLDRGATYFWRVKAIEPVEGDWSTIANFTVAELAPAAEPPVVIEQTPAPVINIPEAPPATVVEIPPAPAAEQIAPAYIWAIIIIGAVLVIAVIVLIVRTRRQV